MKKITLIPLLLITLFFITNNTTFGQEIPFGVSPKEITVSGSIDFDEPNLLGLAKGKLTQSYEYRVGNRIGVKLSGLNYTLRFWNVGEMGGTSGYLFWKKDFGLATLNIDYNIDAPGQIITDEVKTPMGLSYPMEPADDIPSVDGTSCFLRFTGGPKGTFKGTCGNGAQIEGRIGGAGSFAVFEKITQPADPKNQSLALSLFGINEMRLNGEFGDWKFDESTLEDSGARFSSISGEVDVRHDNDSAWQFPKLDTVLYVLDHVKTSEDSSAIIGFADLSTFALKEESEIVITTPPKKDSKLKLVAGNIWVNVKKMIKDGTMEVEMSQAVAGIKGTRFILSESGTESKIEVTEGTVEFKSKADGSIAMVSAGESVIATASGLSEKTTFDASARDQELLEITSTPLPQNNPTSSTAPASNDTKINWAIVLTVVVVVLVSLYLIMRHRRHDNNLKETNL